ncbi:MAG: pantetheine-phosphate adenylyltransferase [Cardiobacteriaceae bacterium]|nr:pantetheine-phosphate adenylyltransferase [Cardiobacteriaceae bacterium]
MTRSAIYPGTFDPVTKGHENIIQRASTLCDRLYIAVALGHHKKTLFDVHERLEMMHIVTKDIQSSCDIQLITLDGLLIKTCQQYHIDFIIRGIRNVIDYEYEHQLSQMNRHLLSDIETVFLITDERYSFVSSNLIRETIALGGNVDTLIHPSIKKILTMKICKKS